MMMKTAIAAALLLCASAHPLDIRADTERVVALPQFRFPKTCGLKGNLTIKPHMAALLQENNKNIPGAGIDKFTPFETIYKDGFAEVDCVKDYMYYRGDKFGDNKHDYKLGDTSKVSIVHYEAFVAKEDQVPMTQKVCFEFCRTIPNMGFFGIVNGRGCYCTPYFKPMESDSTQCDSVCEGETTLMCGGKSKSSVFSMHMCASTKEDLGILTGKAGSLSGSMGGALSTASSLGSKLQSQGTSLQKTFGAVGDSGATALAQAAKVYAGEIEKSAKAAKAIKEKLDDLQKDAAKLSGFTDPVTVTKAERIMEDIEETLAEGIAAEDELTKLNELADEDSVKDAAKQYYPVMYFVDKKFDSVPSTCGGELTEKPMVTVSPDACAAACDNAIHECVGFQYFSAGPDTCYLFSKFESAFYYTGCSAFLQAKKSPFTATCYAKLSKFEGTSLAVDKSGKTDFGMKKITKADRCY